MAKVPSLKPLLPLAGVEILVQKLISGERWALAEIVEGVTKCAQGKKSASRLHEQAHDGLTVTILISNTLWKPLVHCPTAGNCSFLDSKQFVHVNIKVGPRSPQHVLKRICMQARS